LDYVTLLEIGWEAMHVLIVWENSLGLRAKKVVIPDTKQAENDGDVLVERRGLEMMVHLVCAKQQVMEVIKTNIYRD